MSLFSRMKKLLDGNSLQPVAPQAPPPDVSQNNIELDQLATQPDSSEQEIPVAAIWEGKQATEWNIGDNILDTFTVLDIKAGNMGRVYIVEHRERRQKVAIKAPNEKMLADSTLFARVIREAQQWIDLGLHPHIAYCYYVRQINEIPHIFIEYIDGGNLRDWICAARCHELKVGLDVAIQFCHGMEYADQFGMVHRDIKPENILMTENGTLKITDFGLARMNRDADEADASAGNGVSKQHEQLTVVGQKGVGTFAYMAPEQYLDLRSVDTRADIYSFGVCLYEMFCGCRPFEYESREVPPSILAKYQGHKALDPRKNRLDIPAKLAALLERCCALDKDSRYQSFAELRQNLLAIYRDLYRQDPPHVEITRTNLKADGLNNRGVSYWDLGQEEDARRCWEEALKEDSQHLAGTFNLGYMKWHKAELGAGEFLSRLRNLESAQEVDPDYWLCLAWVYYEQGYVDEIKKLQQSIHAVKDEDFLRALKDKGRPLGLGVRQFEGHTGMVTSVCFSPDGRYVLTGSGNHLFSDNSSLQLDDNTARLWEMKSGREIRNFKGHADTLIYVDFSPNGKYVLTGSRDKTTRVWDAECGWELKRIEGQAVSVNSSSFSPDGRELWRFDAHVNSVSFSPDGQYVLTGSADVARLWGRESGCGIRKFEGHTGEVNCVSFSPDGLYAITGSFDTTARLWETESGREIRKFEGHTESVNSVKFSPEGRFVLTGSDDTTARLWEAKSGQELRRFEGHTESVSSVSFSPDGRYVLTGSWDHTARLWECRYGRQIINRKLFPLLARLQDSAGLVRNQAEVSGFLRAAETEIERGNWQSAFRLAQKARQVPGFERSEHALELIARSGNAGKGWLSRLADAWQVRQFIGHTNNVTSVSFSPDGQYILTGSLDNTARLWDKDSGREIRKFEGHTGEVNCVCFSPDGLYVMTGSGDYLARLSDPDSGKNTSSLSDTDGLDNTARLWETESGREIRKFKGHRGAITSVSISPDGRYVLTGSWDTTARLWEMKSGLEIRRFEGHTCWVSSVSFSPDGRYALTGSGDKTARLWDTEKGMEIRKFDGHLDYVTSVSFFPDGRFVLTGSWDTTARLWDAKSGMELRRMVHNQFVESVKFSPDGRYVLTGCSGDNTALLWETESEREVRRLEVHTKSVTSSVSFSPDGRYVLAGSWDKTARLWELDWEWEFPAEIIGG